MATALDELNLHDSDLLSIAIRGAPHAEIVMELDYIVSYESMETTRARLRFEEVAMVDLGMVTWIDTIDSIRDGRTLDSSETRQILAAHGLSHVNEQLHGHVLETATTASRVIIVCRTLSLEIVA